MQNKIIDIKCDVKDYLSIGEFTPLQGNLKTKTKEDLTKLKNLIISKGFTFPFFVARVGKNNFTLDGHGRDIISAELRDEGYQFKKPSGEIGLDLPVVYVKCKNRVEAKELLLYINSRYGKITEEGLSEFLNEKKYQIDLEEIKLNLSLPDIHLDIFGEDGRVKSINEQEEWEGFPEFTGDEDPYKIIIQFEDDQTRDEFLKKNNFLISSKQGKTISTWWPPKEKQDLKSLKYE